MPYVPTHHRVFVGVDRSPEESRIALEIILHWARVVHAEATADGMAVFCIHVVDLFDRQARREIAEWLLDRYDVASRLRAVDGGYRVDSRLFAIVPTERDLCPAMPDPDPGLMWVTIVDAGVCVTVATPIKGPGQSESDI